MEGFFLCCSSFNEIELKELLLRRYHSLSFIDDMDLLEFVEFCNLARRKEDDDKLYLRWCIWICHTTEPCSFNEFADKITGRNIDTRSTDEIIAEINAAHDRARKE